MEEWSLASFGWLIPEEIRIRQQKLTFHLAVPVQFHTIGVHCGRLEFSGLDLSRMKISGLESRDSKDAKMSHTNAALGHAWRDRKDGRYYITTL